MNQKTLKFRLLAGLIMVAMMLGIISMSTNWQEAAYAAEKDSITVYVTMAVKGEIAVSGSQVMANVPVTLEAEDGVTTVDAVLKAFHQKYKEGGYTCGEYVTQLWGIETSNTLFFLNDKSCTQLPTSEPVGDGDRITASVNSDDKYYSDYYAYFDQTEITNAQPGSELTLTLLGYTGMSAEETAKALEGIQIGIAGKDGFAPLTDVTTDKDGKVTIKLDQETFPAGGTYIISAKGTIQSTATDWSAEGQPVVKVDAPIIAPACKVNVETKLTLGVKNTKLTDLSAKVSRGKVILTWKKSAGYKVDGYQVWKSTKKNSGYKKIATVTARKCTNTKELKKGSRYYYKVRGIRSVNGKTIYTNWSEKITVQAK